jgi:uncharacterized RDD family membrane protein YckC
VALIKLTDADFSALSWAELAIKQAELSPYINEITIAIYSWTASEVVVLLFNRKKRALHDFIAGTVVVTDFGTIETTPSASTGTI